MPTVGQRAILWSLHKGAVILVQYTNHPPSAAKRTYRLSTTQKAIPEKTIQRMLNERLIRPNNDGLLGADGPVQSYSLWRASEGGA